MIGFGVLAVLGLTSLAGVMAWKRAQARGYFARGGTLPEPGKHAPGSQWSPTYTPRGMLVATPNPSRPGSSLFILARARLVRGLDPTRMVGGQPAPHWGIDLAAPIGAPIHAAKDGTVTRAGPISGYGNTVVIRQEDGKSTLYGHMNRIGVRVGQRVRGGDIIGEVGRTTAGPDGVEPSWGRGMAAHLHMEVHPTPDPVLTRMARRLDPIRWLQNEGIAQYEARA